MALFPLICSMFTGIIEAQGLIREIRQEQDNFHFVLTCPFTSELKVDQSLSHNGVCLTVTRIAGEAYEVTAVKETLSRTNLGSLKTGDRVNLERCMPASGRFDGHIVQGHVDCKGIFLKSEDQNGSWKLHFEHPENHITVEKGSITINGVSLTVVDSNDGSFSVVIIPYTWEHTNLSLLKPGDSVNLEFDIVGKYIAKMLNKNQ